MRFFTSDWHFGHRLCSQMRGFGDDTEAHDAKILELHNKAVRHDDDVTYFLGDLTMSRPSLYWPIVDAMKGRKIAVVGNHDAPFPAHKDALRHQREWLEHFEAVVLHARVKLAGEEVMLSHLPYIGGGDHTHGPERFRQWRLTDEGRMLLCGHVHDKWRQSGSMINVGVDQWDMIPVREDELERRIVAYREAERRTA